MAIPASRMPIYDSPPWSAPCEECARFHRRADTGQITCRQHRSLRGINGELIPCMKIPEAGGVVCSTHGGAFPVAREKAAERRDEFQQQIAQGKVGKLLEELELDLSDVHPLDGILEGVRRAGGMMRLLGALTGQLDVIPGLRLERGEEEDWETQKERLERDGSVELPERARQVGIYGKDHLGDQAAHILLTLYDRWHDKYTKACKLALDANIDERLVRNAEATTDSLYRALGRALEAAKLEPEQTTRLKKTLAAELRKALGPAQDGVIDGRVIEEVVPSVQSSD